MARLRIILAVSYERCIQDFLFLEKLTNLLKNGLLKVEMTIFLYLSFKCKLLLNPQANIRLDLFLLITYH
jgi:hypothetical protein